MPKYLINTRPQNPELGRNVLRDFPLLYFELNYGNENIIRAGGMNTRSATSTFAILSSDIFRNYNGRQAGGNPYGLAYYIRELNMFYRNCWKAGHLLNQDFGGSGDANNLTPLTTHANRNHEIFERHIRQIGQELINFEANHPYSPYWYGIEYEIIVSPVPFLWNFDINNILNGVYSHLAIRYGLTRFAKRDFLEEALFDINELAQPVIPILNVRNDNTIRGFNINNNFINVEIHNCPEHLGLNN